MKNIKIGERIIGEENEPFIIAEAGINHNGDIILAKAMVDVASEVGADAIKFQTFSAEEFIRDDSLMYTYKSQGMEITEPMLEMFKRYEFSNKQWKEIKNYCDEKKIMFISTPQNVSDLELLMELGVDAIKIGSDDFVNTPLICRYALEGKTMILSCGMAYSTEIDEVINCLQEKENDMVLMLCTSQYPTAPKNVNIRRLWTLSQKYPELVLGFSDHTRGTEAAVMAVYAGARIFEKHFTLSHDYAGPDHWFSEEPHSLKMWIKAIKNAYLMIGSGVLEPTNEEREMRKIAHRSITLSQDVESGQLLTEKNTCLQRPGTGIPAREYNVIVGKRINKNLPKGYQIRYSDIE